MATPPLGFGNKSSASSSTSSRSSNGRVYIRSKFHCEYMFPQYEYPEDYKVLSTYTPEKTINSSALDVSIDKPPDMGPLFAEPAYLELYLRDLPWYRQNGRNYYPDFNSLLLQRHNYYFDQGYASDGIYDFYSMYAGKTRNSLNGQNFLFYTPNDDNYGRPRSGHLVNRLLNQLRSSFKLGYSFYGFHTEKRLFYFVKTDAEIPCPVVEPPKSGFLDIFKRKPPPVVRQCTFPNMIQVEIFVYSRGDDYYEFTEVMSFTQKKKQPQETDNKDYGYLISNVQLNPDESARDTLRANLTKISRDDLDNMFPTVKLTKVDLTIAKATKRIANEIDENFIYYYYLDPNPNNEEQKEYPEKTNKLKRLFNNPPEDSRYYKEVIAKNNTQPINNDLTATNPEPLVAPVVPPETAEAAVATTTNSSGGHGRRQRRHTKKRRQSSKKSRRRRRPGKKTY
jgi:hypothetical protein